jgi:organic radical activating enzyme
MKQPVAIINKDFENYLSVDFNISNVCNFSCHYCHPGSNEGNKKFPKNYAMVVENFDHLLNVYKTYFNKTNVKIEITGGEPTLWPKLPQFTKHLKTVHAISNIAITTNASRTLRWWKESSQYFDEVHISLHPQEGNAEHIINIADYLYNETQTHVAVNVIMDPTDWDKSKDNLKTVTDWKTPWLVKTWMLIKEKHLRQDYTRDQLNFFQDKVHKLPPQEYIDRMMHNNIIPGKSNAQIVFDDGTVEPYNSFMLRTNNLHNFYGWNCNLGVDRVPIIFGEIIGSCGAKNIFNATRPLSIFSQTFLTDFNADIIKSITCQQTSCGSCTKDLKIPKEKLPGTKQYIPILNVQS